MSRSNNVELNNPATRFFEWSGADGLVRYYDKEKAENVDVELPFKFLILDRVSQVTGGIDRNNGYEGFWSNAVRNTRTQPFVVRSKAGIEAQGLYEHIKGVPGVRYMQGLYIAFYDDDAALQIGYLKIKGTALTEWIDFVKSHKNIYTGAFGIKGKVKKKKGTNTYFAPVFDHYPKVSDEADAMATALDKHLQNYLDAYFEQQGLQNEVVATVDESGNGNGHDREAYRNANDALYGNNEPDVEDDPVDVDEVYEDDIPF